MSYIFFCSLCLPGHLYSGISLESKISLQPPVACLPYWVQPKFLEFVFVSFLRKSWAFRSKNKDLLAWSQNNVSKYLLSVALSAGTSCGVRWSSMEYIHIAYTNMYIPWIIYTQFATG